MRAHPTPPLAPFYLPIATARAIRLFSYEGDVILDPFMGSGTTAVAAIETGRHYVGYDSDAGYLETARTRIAAARGITAT